MTLDISIIIAYIVGIIFLYIIGRVFLIPMKYLVKLIANVVIGGIILIVINFIGGFIGFYIALNVFSALAVGMLGVPGVILLVVLQFIFK